MDYINKYLEKKINYDHLGSVVGVVDDGWWGLDDQLDYEGPQSAWVYQKYDTHGRKNSTYAVYFSYKNVMVWVELSSEVDTTNDPRLAVDLANRMLEKLKAEPLVMPEEAILAK